MSEEKNVVEREPYVAIDQAVIDEYGLDPMAGWLYVVILSYLNRKTNDAFPSIDELAKAAQMSKASVLRYTKVLEKKKLITVKREKKGGGNQVNHYQSLRKVWTVADSNLPSIPQQPPPLEVVSVSNLDGTCEQLGVVAESEHNQSDLNHQELTTKESTPLSPAMAQAVDSAASKAYQPIDTDTAAMMQADVYMRVYEAACKEVGAPQSLNHRDRNLQRIGAQYYRDGYQAEEITNATKVSFAEGKLIPFPFLANKMGSLRASAKKNTPAQMTSTPRPQPNFDARTLVNEYTASGKNDPGWIPDLNIRPKTAPGGQV